MSEPASTLYMACLTAKNLIVSNIWLELSDNMDATCFSSHMEFEIGCGEVTISSPPDGPRSAEPGVALLLWRWPLEEANKGKTANEARRNETETRHEANKGNDKQATKHDDTKQNGTRQDETKAAAPTAEPQGGVLTTRKTNFTTRRLALQPGNTSF